ncbi:MAG TPA: formylmethanofuran--tetrahydromethanopterin N-formyltransferase, partial [Rhizobacter sp.]|nr:formylmethanofuran--tetrahydromethanopterin N-formyltransferase [Rhizobacter sp.]
AAMRRLPNVVMPFPGGVVRSGSKVGSKYASLSASTNDAFCPSLYGLVGKSEITPETRCVLEIVIDGLTEADVGAAMRVGMQAGIAEGEAIALGKNLRFFGDGWQISKVIAGVRYWRIPVMDGEFVAQETTAVVKCVGGGNLLLMCRDTDAALAVAEAAVAAMKALPNVIMPFPGGVVRSGSKVGSKYASLSASTNDAFCPSLHGLVAQSEITPETRCVLEIVIDGLTEADVGAAMRVGMQAGIALGAAGGLLRISAGNYGGKLGPYLFHLHKLLAVEGTA